MSEMKEIKFKYVFADDYNPIYCNGALGGISPGGEIVANFYLERTPIPNSVLQTINEDGTLSGVIESDPEDINKICIRYISNGIIMNEDSAKALYSWLGNQIQELENRKQSNTVELGT